MKYIFAGVSVFTILAGLAVINGFSSILAAGMVLTLVGLFFAARATTGNSSKFWEKYLAPLTLACAGIFLLACAFQEIPETQSPDEPKPSVVSFVVSPHEKKLKQLDVRVVAFLPKRWGRRQGNRECELIRFTGSEVKSTKGWHVNVEVPKEHDIIPKERRIRALYTTMIDGPPKKIPKTDRERIDFRPRRGQRSQVSICWPAAKALLITTRGSKSAISMPVVNILRGTKPAQLPGKPVRILAMLGQCDCKWWVKDWAVDSGSYPTPAQGSQIWAWRYSISTQPPLYSPSVELRVHRIGKAEEDHAQEFTSGALFGVAAAAFVAATQEGLNSVMKKNKR